MKVGITGGHGFLGGYVIEEMKRIGWEPIIIARNADYGTELLTDYRYEDLSAKLNGFDAIVHLAASRGVSDSIAAYHPSEILCENVLRACKDNGIRNVVFASSISVYSNSECLPWSESQLAYPVSLYGISKYACELLAHYHNRQGMAIKCLRFAHLFGFNEQNNYMINLFMRQAFNHQTLSLMTKSSSKRAFLYAKDAARAIITAIQAEEARGIFNIGHESNSLTNQEVAEMINRVFGNQGNLQVMHPDQLDTSKPSYMSVQLAKEVLGYQADYSFEAAMEEIYQQMKELNDVPIRI